MRAPTDTYVFFVFAFKAPFLIKRSRCLQVAVKKLQTAQVSSEALTQFKVKLQTLAFASNMCYRLCRLLGFVVIDGSLCLVMRQYQQSLQQLLASSEGGGHASPSCAMLCVNLCQH